MYNIDGRVEGPRCERCDKEKTAREIAQIYEEMDEQGVLCIMDSLRHCIKQCEECKQFLLDGSSHLCYQ